MLGVGLRRWNMGVSVFAGVGKLLFNRASGIDVRNIYVPILGKVEGGLLGVDNEVGLLISYKAVGHTFIVGAEYQREAVVELEGQ